MVTESYLDNLQRMLADIKVPTSTAHPHLSSAGALNENLQKVLDELAELDESFRVDRDGTVDIAISPDEMTATCHIHPPSGNGSPMTTDNVLSALETSGVIHGVERALVESACATPNTTVAVASGTPVTHGTPERYVLDQRFENRNRVPETIERVDFKEFYSTPPVRKDDLLMTIVPSQPGYAGSTVTGMSIPPQQTQSKDKPKFGSNVRVNDNTVLANCDGDLRWTGLELDIVHQRTIGGDVDMSTGNVDFPGSVVIIGSITDGFSVKCSGNLSVGGVISNATATTGGNLVVKGGIVGSKSLVSADGDISTLFIEMGNVSSQGNIIVSKEVMHATLTAFGAIVLKNPRRGTIVGSNIFVGKKLHCQSIGRSGAGGTTICFGEDFLTLRKAEEYDSGTARIRKKMVELETALITHVLNSNTRHVVTAQHTKLKEMLTFLLMHKAELLSQCRVIDNPRVIVEGVTQPGTLLKYKTSRYAMTTPTSNAKFSIVSDKIVLGPYR